MKITKKTETTLKGEKVSYNFTQLTKEQKDALVKGLALIKEDDAVALYLYNALSGLDD